MPNMRDYSRWIAPLFVTISWASTAIAQQSTTSHQLTIQAASSDIILDGQLDESAWQETAVASHFWQNFPAADGPANGQTEVKVTYDEEFLYVGAICRSQQEGDYVVTSLRRDFSWNSNDVFCILIDPYNDRNNGFMFGTNPWGVQREGLIANGSNISTDWDNKWFVEVSREEDQWVLEMAIPFRTLRYNADNKEWNIQFNRNDLKINERSAWAPVPLGYNLNSLAFAGKLLWDKNPPKGDGKFTLIPFVSGGGVQRLEPPVGNEPPQLSPIDYTGKIGLDAKVAVSSALNLDLTLNPDFSQVEVDQQVTNLDRFELFFPERRQFFLENSDLFSSFGFSNIRPFYSRRIGLDAPVLSGARLSGKPNQKWRVGLLNVQTRKVEQNNTPARNYTVGAFQRQVFARSVISGIVVNQQATSFLPNDTLGYRPYNRVVGLDYNLRSADDRWSGIFFYHRSFDSETQGQSFAHAAYLGYNTKNLFLAWNHEMVGDDYTAETGFVRRNGVLRLEPFARYSFFPDSKIIQRHGPRLRLDLYTDNPYGVDTVLDRNISLSYSLDFLNTSSASLETVRYYTLLFADFDPARTGSDTVKLLEAGTAHTYQRYSASLDTDQRRWWNLGGSVSWGEYFNGHRLEAGGTLNMRFQPYGNFSLRANYNRIRLPQGYASVDYWLIAPRLDITFTDALFWTTFVQYNAQNQQLGLNTRFQWRFAPVSDFFIVYTDNYLEEGQNWTPNSRGLIMKLTYWLNI